MVDFDIDNILDYLNKQLNGGVEFRYVISQYQDVLQNGIYLYDNGDIADTRLAKKVVGECLPSIKDIFEETNEHYYIPKHKLSQMSGGSNE